MPLNKKSLFTVSRLSSSSPKRHPNILDGDKKNKLWMDQPLLELFRKGQRVVYLVQGRREKGETAAKTLGGAGTIKTHCSTIEMGPTQDV